MLRYVFELMQGDDGDDYGYRLSSAKTTKDDIKLIASSLFDRVDPVGVERAETRGLSDPREKATVLVYVVDDSKFYATNDEYGERALLRGNCLCPYDNSNDYFVDYDELTEIECFSFNDVRD